MRRTAQPTVRRPGESHAPVGRAPAAFALIIVAMMTLGACWANTDEARVQGVVKAYYKALSKRDILGAISQTGVSLGLERGGCPFFGFQPDLGETKSIGTPVVQGDQATVEVRRRPCSQEEVATITITLQRVHDKRWTIASFDGPMY